MKTWTAEEIVGLLGDRHGQDVFVAECKNGPTWGTQYMRLDAWAMEKSWSPWRTIGYEIKVSRSDFMADQKWMGYLPVCHEFFFVCPAGLIRTIDFPPGCGVGLIWVSQSGRLVAKTKAARRKPDPEQLAQLMSYVLMSRVRVVADMHEAARAEEPSKTKEQLYRDLVVAAETRGHLAHFVQRHIRERYEAMEQRAEQAEKLHARVGEIVATLEKHGITWDTESGWNTWEAKEQIERRLGDLDARELRGSLAQVKRATEEAMRVLDERIGKELP